jgi:hypothetical protein
VIAKHQSSLARQFAALKQSDIVGGSGRLFPSYFYWECDICPTPLSRTYHILIFLGSDQVPRAFVLDPNLKDLAEGKTIPHLYHQSKAHLCLYYPFNYEWKASMSIANDFVPWIYLWLMFFEQWLATGKWYGGGIHLDTPVGNVRTQKRKANKRPKKNLIRELAYKVRDKRLQGWREYQRTSNVENKYTA